MENDQETEERERLSVEMILRRSFLDSAKEYMQNCSLGGAMQLRDPNNGVFQRIIWTIVFLTSFLTAGYFLYYVWTDSLNKPLIVTLESTDYPIVNIDFPAIAICNINRISKKALAKLAVAEYEDLAEKESLEEVQRALLNLGRLMDFTYNDTINENKIIRRFIDKYRFDSEKVIQIMKDLAPRCEESLLECVWDGAMVECSKIFTMRRTANRGFCCTFNYVLNYNMEMENGITKSTDKIKRQKGAGFLQGLTVALDPQLEDYAYPLSNMEGFDILVFDAMHFADPYAGRVNHRINEPNSALFLEIKSTKQVATGEIRKYSLKTRGCLFRDEMPDLFLDMYSYSTCIVLCRIITIRSLCKCVPFYFATSRKLLDWTPVCTLENLKCLNKYKEKLYSLYPFGSENIQGLETEQQDSLNCPACWPDCEIIKYTTKAFEAPLVTLQKEKTLRNIIFEEILEHTNKSIISIYFPTSDSTLIRFDVVTYWYEILSNVGGFCGIIAGFSIISVVEIIYFFTIRYVHHFIRNYKMYH